MLAYLFKEIRDAIRDELTYVVDAEAAADLGRDVAAD
jgi:hypothetical protein